MGPKASDFAGVVEDHVEDRADAGVAERGDGGGELGQAAGAEARVGGHEDDGVVAPAVGQAEGQEVALVDPGGDRHQLDRVDAEAGQVVEDRRVGEGGDGAADRGRHLGVEDGEGADGDLVDQAAGAEDRRLWRGRRGEGGDDGLRHQGRGVDGGVAGGGEAGVVGEGTVEGDGVGVDEELRRVEAMALLRGDRGRRRGSRSGCRQRRRGRSRTRRRRRRGSSARRVSRSPSKRQSQTRVGATRTTPRSGCRRGRASRRGAAGRQVMTSGAARPVLSVMSASLSARRRGRRERRRWRGRGAPGRPRSARCRRAASRPRCRCRRGGRRRGAALEEDADALVRRDRAVDRVVVGEVVGRRRLCQAVDAACRAACRAGRGARPPDRWRRRCRPPRSRGGSSSCGRRSPSARARSRSPAACARRGC